MISFLIKPASSLCNMKCSYCFYCDEADKREKPCSGLMQKETAHNIIKKAAAFSREASFVFQGGEPLLAGVDFFEDFASFADECGIRAYFSIQTNGLLIDEKYINFFKKRKVLLGISLDGVERVHNCYRKTFDGEGTFSKVFENIKVLQHNGVDFNILTVVTPEVAESIEEIYTFYMANGFYYQQYIPCIDPFDSVDRILSNEKYADFLKRLFTLYFNDRQKGKPVSVRYFDNLLMKLNGMSAEECGMNGCCSIQLVVEGDGTVYPCDFYCVDGKELGNINSDSITGLFKSERAKAFVEDNYTTQECKQCSFFSLCAGGCKRYRADGLNKFCRAYKEFFKFSLG